MANYLLWCLFSLTYCVVIDAQFASNERCKEIKKGIDLWIKKQANQTHPSSLPTPVNVKDECLDFALQCFRFQIQNLTEASGQNKSNFTNHIRKVRLSKMHTPRNKDCRNCNDYPTMQPKDFLKNMSILLQRIISRKPSNPSG